MRHRRGIAPWQVGLTPSQVPPVEQAPLVHTLPPVISLSVGQVVATPLQFSARSQLPAAGRHTVPSEGFSCVGGACDFKSGMIPPLLLERGREPELTREALEAHVEGLMTVQCVVTIAGRLEHCQVIRSLPHMERAVVEALMTRRYTPATLDGRPLPVRYVFHVKLVMPR